ncbi:pectinesterase family protein [Treponema berlinense]|uniref:pectinesterase family protein n=1 Tax=Treponema berlinense TaxID=225004 RepID=UPI0026F20DCE|nr:pectinesterase family protein [Treponema berlinense]
MKKLWKAFAVCCAIAMLGSAFTACKSDDDDDDDDKPVTPSTPVEEVDTTALYRFNATADCDFVDGKITNFDGSEASSSGAFLYYPHQLNLETDNVVLEATLNFSNVATGRVGIGAIGRDGTSLDGYAFLTGIQKVRYGKSSSLDPAKTENGQGFDTSILTSNKVEASKDYTFRITLKDGQFTYEILDGETVVATKSSNYTTYFTSSDKVFFAIGAHKGQTANATWSNIKVTVNGTSYSVTEIKDSPDCSKLSIGSEKTEINVNDSKEISFDALNKAGEACSVTVNSSDETIASAKVENGKIVVTAIKAGTCTITVVNEDNDGLKKEIEVAVVDIVNSEAPSALLTYPVKDATAAYEDGEWMIGGFDAEPKLLTGGRIKIYEVGDGNVLTEVDTIEFADETQSVWDGTSLNVGDQLVRVEGNAVYFTPHIGKIAASKKYIVVVPKECISGTVGGVAFEGLTNDVSKSSFVFTTRAAKTISTTITVDGSQNSSADFRSIQSALRAIGKDDAGSYTIKVAKGTYHELLYFNGKADVKISGDTTTKHGADVIVQYDNATCINSNEKTRNLLSFIGGDLILENITLKNTLSRAKYGKGDTQAEALGFDSPAGKFVAAYNCSFISHQDTIRIIQKGWFYDCYIVGDVDFIWGETNSLACVIEKCTIESVYEAEAGSNVARILASKTGDGKQTIVTKGFVILNSEIICGSESDTYLGRTPWSSGTINQCAVINTTVKSGSLNENRWEGTACKVDGVEQKYIGWKEYNSGATTGTDSFAVIDDEMYSNEYSGRRAILNRVIDISDKANPKFIYDDSSRYDIDALIAEQGWTVAEDTSKEVLDGEAAPDERTRVTWDFNNKGSKGDATFGEIFDGVKFPADDGFYADDSSKKIDLKISGTFKSNGNCAQHGDGTEIKVPVVTEGDSIYVTGFPGYTNFTIGGTTYTDGEEHRYDATAADVAAGYVTITGNSNQYILKIVARYTTLPNKPEESAVVISVYDFTESGKIKDKDGNETTEATVSDTGWTYHGSTYGLQASSADAYVTFPVLGDSVIGIQGYEGSGGTFDLISGETVVKASIPAKTSKGSISTFFIYKGEAGTLKLKVSNKSNVYLAKVQVKTLEDEKEGITSISVNDPGSVTLAGTTMTAAVTASYCGSTAVTWSVSDAGTTGATIDAETGVLTVTAAGTLTVKATSVLDPSKSAERTVTVSSYEVNAFADSFVEIDKNSSITKTTTGSTESIKYGTADEAIATVNESTGEVTGVKAGFVKIYAYNEADTAKSVKAEYTVCVNPLASETYTWTSTDYNTYGQAEVTGEEFTYNSIKFDTTGTDTNGNQARVKKHSTSHIQIFGGTIIKIPVDSAKTTTIVLNFSANGGNVEKVIFGTGETDYVTLTNSAATIEDANNKAVDGYIPLTIQCKSGSNTYIGGNAIVRTVSE